jgi:cell wall-associated NlpC family hydrolase
MRLNDNEKIVIRDLCYALVNKEPKIKYRLGAETINSFEWYSRNVYNVKISDIVDIDCSESVEWIFWNGLKIKVPDGSWIQFECSTPVRIPEIGDLVFKKDNEKVRHVGIYVGMGNIFEAAGGSLGIVIRSLDEFIKPTTNRLFAGIRRLDLSLINEVIRKQN